MPRGERGGKKIQLSKSLIEATLRGQHQPTSEPSSASGIRRVVAIAERIAQEPAVPTTESQESRTPPVPDSTTSVAQNAAEESAVVTSAGVEPVGSRLSGSRASSRALKPCQGAPSSSKGAELPAGGVRLSELDRSVKPRLGPPQAIQEIRISLDFNNVLNIAQAGDQEFDGIHPNNVWALKEFIRNNVDRGVRVGVTSYIGTKGSKSQARRTRLFEVVRAYDQSVVDSLQHLGVWIVSSPCDKGIFLQQAGAVVRVDDRLSCLNSCSRSIHTYWVTRSSTFHNTHIIVPSLEQALLTIRTVGKSQQACTRAHSLRSGPYLSDCLFTIFSCTYPALARKSRRVDFFVCAISAALTQRLRGKSRTLDFFVCGPSGVCMEGTSSSSFICRPTRADPGCTACL